MSTQRGVTVDDAPLSVIRQDIEDAASDFTHHASSVRGLLLRERLGASINLTLRYDIEHIERALKKLVSDLKKAEGRLALERLGRRTW